MPVSKFIRHLKAFKNTDIINYNYLPISTILFYISDTNLESHSPKGVTVALFLFYWEYQFSIS